MTINREELAWAAGLFEGEGTFSTRNMSKGGINWKHGGKRDRGLIAAIKMADEDIVARFYSIVKVGSFNGPYKCDGIGSKALWKWQTGSFEAVQHTMTILWPWLGIRRRAKIKELLAHYHARPPIMKAIERDPKTGRLLSGRFVKYVS